MKGCEVEVIIPRISREMLAAGLEAMRAARADCLPDADVVSEIFIAMYGIGTFFDPETVH